MEWTDNAIILSARAHGETAAIVSLLTAEKGRFAGLVPGGQSRKKTPLLQPGSLVQARWRARLEDHLGTVTFEPVESTAAAWLDDPEILALISSATAILEASLPERQPVPALYDSLVALFSVPDRDLWAPAYVKWEIGILKALGYGIDLSCCALTGERDGLAYISPRTGRAVTNEAAAPFRDKLLPLPRFLCGDQEWDQQDILHGLDLTGHFLSRHVFSNPQNRRLVPLDGMLPLARQRLAAFYKQKPFENERLAAAAVA